MRETGMYPGAADIFVIHVTIEPSIMGLIRKRYIWIETKYAKGVQSKVQKKFQRHCEQMNEEYHIVRSSEDFWEVINNPK